MNPVATANILLSTNLANLERFAADKTLKADAGSYLFSAKNTNFISLEHRLGEKDPMTLKIVMQDPNNGVLENLVPKDILPILENMASIQDPRKLDYRSYNFQFFVMYGLGTNAAQHWAGPFMTQLYDFNYINAEDGTALVELTLIPSLPIQAQLSLQPLNDSVLVYRPWSQTPKGWESLPRGGGKFVGRYTTKMTGSTGMQRKLGSITYTLKDTGKPPRWGEVGIGPDRLVKEIRKLYTNYAERWGIENFLMLMSKDFKNVLLKKLYSGHAAAFVQGALFGIGNKLAIMVSPTLEEAKALFDQFGISLIYFPQPNARGGHGNSLGALVGPAQAQGAGSAGLPAQMPGASPLPVQSKSNTVDVYIDINDSFKRANNFKSVFEAFYGGLAGNIPGGAPIIVDYVMENNTTIVNYLKQSGLKDYIKVEGQPFVVVGDRNSIGREIYNHGGVGITLSPLSDERSGGGYKGLVRDYYVNKVSHYSSNYFEDVGSNDQAYQPPRKDDEDSKTLILKANTPDANIISYNMDANLNSLNAILKVFSRRVAARMKVGQFYHHLKTLTPDADSFKLMEIAENTVKVLKKLASKPLGLSYTVPDDPGPGIAEYMKTFSEEGAEGKLIFGTIRTVPYFQLSDMLMLNSTCEVTIKKNSSPDNYPLDFEDSDSVYNGKYQIIGFNHVITSDDAYSEFEVTKIGYPPGQGKYASGGGAGGGSEEDQSSLTYGTPYNPFSGSTQYSDPGGDSGWDDDECGPDDYG